MREQAEVLRHAAQLRQLIHDVVKHAYKQPVRYDRSDSARETAAAPIRDLASSTMAKTNAGRGAQKQLGATGGTAAGPVDVQVAQAPVSLGVRKWDAKVGAAR